MGELLSRYLNDIGQTGGRVNELPDYSNQKIAILTIYIMIYTKDKLFAKKYSLNHLQRLK